MTERTKECLRAWNDWDFRTGCELVLESSTDPTLLSELADLAAERALPGWTRSNSQVLKLSYLADIGDTWAILATDLCSEANAAFMGRLGLSL